MIFFRAIDLDSPNSLSNQGVLLLFFFPSRHGVNLELTPNLTISYQCHKVSNSFCNYKDLNLNLMSLFFIHVYNI